MRFARYGVDIFFYNILISLFLSVVTACDQTPGTHNETMNDYHVDETTINALQKIAQKRILLAHHSVGENIINGLKDISSETHTNFHVRKVGKTIPMEKGVFLHVSPGINKQPKSKIDDFVALFNDAGNLNVDIAFLKFCYIDFTPGTDAADVFRYYKEKMKQLQKSHPEVTFVHCTVPLTERSMSVKDRIKRLVGREVWGDSANKIRAEYNELLFSEFGDEPIFDLARIESTRLDGTREMELDGGTKYYSLVSDYTDDGGHLNDLGRKIAATNMIQFLDMVLEKRGS